MRSPRCSGHLRRTRFPVPAARDQPAVWKHADSTQMAPRVLPTLRRWPWTRAELQLPGVSAVSWFRSAVTHFRPRWQLLCLRAWRRGAVGWRKTRPWPPWWGGALSANAPLPTGPRPAGSDRTPALRHLEGRLMATPALAAQPGPGRRTRPRKFTDSGGGGDFFFKAYPSGRTIIPEIGIVNRMSQMKNRRQPFSVFSLWGNP